MRRHDAIFLDAQGTLLRAQPSVPAIYAEVYRRFGGKAREREVTAAMQAEWAELRAAPDSRAARYDTSEEITRRWWANFNGRMFRRLGMPEPLDRFLDALWEAFGTPENWELYPEAEGVLRELKVRGYRLGIVSNWDSRLIPICQRLGLDRCVDFIVASAAAGAEKPDKRIFEVALARAGVAPERAIHVGDDYRADVLGAQGAGIEAILIDRDGQADTPALTIHSLTELLPILS